MFNFLNYICIYTLTHNIDDDECECELGYLITYADETDRSVIDCQRCVSLIFFSFLLHTTQCFSDLFKILTFCLS